MSVETRTRVEVFIPASLFKPRHRWVIRLVQEQLAFLHGGATQTATYQGLYYQPSTGKLIADPIRVVFCDLNYDTIDPSQRDPMIAFLSILKAHVQSQLPEEEEIWLTFYPVERITE